MTAHRRFDLAPSDQAAPCYRCGLLTRLQVPVGRVLAASGPDVMLHACPNCIQHFRGILTCGARQPGWGNGPAVGRRSLPCVRDVGHQDDHANTVGDQWPRGHVAVCCYHCGIGTEAPVAVGFIPATSGPGYTLHACPDCATLLGARPTPDDVIR